MHCVDFCIIYLCAFAYRDERYMQIEINPLYVIRVVAKCICLRYGYNSYDYDDDELQSQGE